MGTVLKHCISRGMDFDPKDSRLGTEGGGCQQREPGDGLLGKRDGGGSGWAGHDVLTRKQLWRQSVLLRDGDGICPLLQMTA